MVRNNELPSIGTTAKLIADTIAQLLERKSVSQTQVSRELHRSQSYISVRIRGLDAWTTEDLDKLARILGYTNVFGLLDEVRGIHRN
ncbi:helix-turn-helix domain-containing protein [Bifidobacterium crudilactis]|jgi:transcriptional regulator with XRE-family HTH domain|uniref:helix-turn-helix domain-containing protein n=1 Tax=Bifidobacterium crudilactis TaxID=327277 RepID=UPI003C6CB515